MAKEEKQKVRKFSSDLGRSCALLTADCERKCDFSKNTQHCPCWINVPQKHTVLVKFSALRRHLNILHALEGDGRICDSKSFLYISNFLVNDSVVELLKYRNPRWCLFIDTCHYSALLLLFLVLLVKFNWAILIDIQTRLWKE